MDLLGTRDFVNSHSDIYAENYHGMKVLSCMAANKPNVLVGTAPEASYWLLRSEDMIRNSQWKRIIGWKLWNLPIVWEWMWLILHWDIMSLMIRP